MKDVKQLRLFLLDMDGTIYLDNNLFDGVTDFLEYIKSIGGRYIFLTNNSSKSVNKYIEKLAGLGISSTADDFLTSTNATILFLHTVSVDFIKTYFQQPSYIAFTISGAL